MTLQELCDHLGALMNAYPKLEDCPVFTTSGSDFGESQFIWCDHDGASVEPKVATEVTFADVADDYIVKHEVRVAELEAERDEYRRKFIAAEQAATVAEQAQVIIGLTEEVERLKDFARDIANNYDHENDAHKYNNSACRKCNAEAALKGTP